MRAREHVARDILVSIDTIIGPVREGALGRNTVHCVMAMALMQLRWHRGRNNGRIGEMTVGAIPRETLLVRGNWGRRVGESVTETIDRILVLKFGLVVAATHTWHATVGNGPCIS